MSAVIGDATLLESVDRRVLGAFICIDSITGMNVTQPMNVSAAPLIVKPNRSGIYVIFSGPGYESLTGQFIPNTAWPAPQPFSVTLRDPNRRYLPRRATVQAPMSVPDIPASPGGVVPNPAVVAALAANGSIFNPQRIIMYPAPSMPCGPAWSTIRASVVRQASAPLVGLPWAMLRVVRQSDAAVLATAQTDANGEALLALVGLTMQPSTSTTGPVMVSTVAVTVTAYIDPTALHQTRDWVANPDDILNNPSNPALESGSQTAQMGSGIELTMNFALAV